MKTIRAIIADDEEALRDYLREKLFALWPELAIVGEARDGEAALRLIEQAKPDIAFLDIKMPGLSGIEVAGRTDGKCLIVLVTAHDQYAVKAFENEALDYLLKPVTDDRLDKTVKRLKERMSTSSSSLPGMAEAIERAARAIQNVPVHLQWIKAQHKDGVRLIPVSEIYYFKATDRYTTVRTRDGEFLIRKTLKELEEELDPDMFWRVHRAAIVNVKAIHKARRSVAGTYALTFKDIQESLTVSRAYCHLFKQM